MANSKIDQLINEEIEDILINMLEKCKLEAETDQLNKPLEDHIGRVAYYTGIPEPILLEIMNKEQSKSLKDIKPLSFENEILILKYITKLYSEKQSPTYETLFDLLKNDSQVDFDIKQFVQKLRLLGIQYRVIFNTTMLIEDANYSFEKYFYLHKIQRLRAKNAKIYYVDVLLIDKKIKLTAPWRDYTAHKTHKYALFYAISKSGFKIGLFCNEVSIHDFNKWVTDVLLSQIEPSSVIIFHNSSFHKTLETKPISPYDTKQVMLKCLQKHNVPYGPKMNKAQLYYLIKKFVNEEEIFSIDQIIKANGHEVLRLPMNMYNLSPTYLMWKELQQSIETSLADQEDIGCHFIDVIETELITMPNKFDTVIQDRENQMLSLYTNLEKAQNQYLSHLKEGMKSCDML